jgi:preprotein translocase subunit SecG
VPVTEFVVWGDWITYLPVALNTLIILAGVFLILLVLIQRGKGGGLSGAFGGVGGSSAFGSRAGDQFTKVTLWAAAIWIVLIMLMVKIMPHKSTTPLHQEAPPPDTGDTRLWVPENSGRAEA